jgi:hypothetical protein
MQPAFRVEKPVQQFCDQLEQQFIVESVKFQFLFRTVRLQFSTFDEFELCQLHQLQFCSGRDERLVAL